jgi:hypothetical protein
MAGMIQTGLVIIVLAITAFSQGEWKRHESLLGGYTVEMPPGEPTTGMRKLEDESGNPITLRSLALTSGAMRFIVSHYDIPYTMKFSFSRTRDGIVKRLNGKIVSESSSKSQGMEARTFRVNATSQGYEIIMTARLLSNGSRVYLMQAIFPRSLENTAAEGNARSFFNSFAIKEEGR